MPGSDSRGPVRADSGPAYFGASRLSVDGLSVDRINDPTVSERS